MSLRAYLMRALRRPAAERGSSGRTGSSRKEAVAYIGEGIRLDGEVRMAEGIAVIAGTIHGTVRAHRNSTISIVRPATVCGDIQAGRVEVSGRVEGDVHADHEVILRAGAHVTGDIYCRFVSLHPGAVIRGRLHQKTAAPGTAPPDGERPVAIASSREESTSGNGVVPIARPAAEHAAANSTLPTRTDGNVGASGGDHTRPVQAEPAAQPPSPATVVRAFLNRTRQGTSANADKRHSGAG